MAGRSSCHGGRVVCATVAHICVGNLGVGPAPSSQTAGTQGSQAGLKAGDQRTVVRPEASSSNKARDLQRQEPLTRAHNVTIVVRNGTVTLRAR